MVFDGGCGTRTLVWQLIYLIRAQLVLARSVAELEALSSVLSHLLGHDVWTLQRIYVAIDI